MSLFMFSPLVGGFNPIGRLWNFISPTPVSPPGLSPIPAIFRAPLPVAVLPKTTALPVSPTPIPTGKVVTPTRAPVRVPVSVVKPAASKAVVPAPRGAVVIQKPGVTAPGKTTAPERKSSTPVQRGSPLKDFGDLGAISESTRNWLMIGGLALGGILLYKFIGGKGGGARRRTITETF